MTPFKLFDSEKPTVRALISDLPGSIEHIPQAGATESIAKSGASSSKGRYDALAAMRSKTYLEGIGQVTAEGCPSTKSRPIERPATIRTRRGSDSTLGLEQLLVLQDSTQQQDRQELR